MRTTEAIKYPEFWNGIKIRYATPYVDRIWMRDGDVRLCLHKIYPIDEESTPYYHPHPWVFETEIVSGSYFMDIGRSPNLDLEPPPVSARIKMVPGSWYRIDSNTWHTVEPINGPVYSVVRITQRVQREVPIECKKTISMNLEEIQEQLKVFRHLLRMGKK